MPEPTFGPATKADTAHWKSQARARDAGNPGAYQAGLDDAKAGTHGQNRPLDPDQGDAYEAGLADGATSSGRPSSGSSHGGGGAGRRPGGGGRSRGRARSSYSGPGSGALAAAHGQASSAGQSASGLILGMIGYALVINYLRGGLPAVRGWFAAKFLNKPYTGPMSKVGPAIGVAKP